MDRASDQTGRDLGKAGSSVLAIHDRVDHAVARQPGPPAVAVLSTHLIRPSAPCSQVTSGDAVFAQIGCDGRHVRNITSGTARDQSGNVITAISDVQYHPFGDFLLHDMGSLNDNIDQGTGFAMRTAPPWGLRFRNPSNLLHDKRAHSIQQAIVAPQQPGNAFNPLSSTNQNNLLAFLQSP